MSRDRIYIYVDGVMRPAWSENTPGAYARMAGYGGSLVVGPSGTKREDMERRAENERQRKAKLRGEAA